MRIRRRRGGRREEEEEGWGCGGENEERGENEEKCGWKLVHHIPRA